MFVVHRYTWIDTVYGLQLYNKNQDLLIFNATGIILDSDSSGSSSDDETASHTERSDRSDADKKVRPLQWEQRTVVPRTKLVVFLRIIELFSDGTRKNEHKIFYFFF
jgi:hypothetical protein